MRLVRFVREYGGVFTKNHLVKVFSSKIDKWLFDLTMPRVIINYSGWTTLAEAFAIVE